MKILMTGATGFIGRALVLRLLRDGHSLRVISQNPKRARGMLGALVEVFEGTIEESVDGMDAVINLAGEPLLGSRWTKKKRELLFSSRIVTTERLVRGMAIARHQPSVFVSASAVGYYGDRGDEVLDESSAPGRGFLVQLCAAWEKAAENAEVFGIRVARIRTGVVLGRGGGALEKMALPARFGIGGRIGSGRQISSWIHLDDLVEIYTRALADDRMKGPINATAPQPVPQLTLQKTMGRVLHRPSIGWVPRFALSLALGEASSVLLDSQDVRPKKLLDLGFEFEFRDIKSALTDLLQDDGVEIEKAEAKPISGYFDERNAKYRLTQRTVLEAPIGDVFEFFSRAENLAALTPRALAFDVVTPTPIAMSRGALVDYRIKVGPVPMNWRTEIQRYESNRSFIDVQLRGPYHAWWHEHRFERLNDHETLMHDTVYYTPPFGVLGRIAQKLLVAPMLRGIFAFRQNAIRLRFGRPRAAAAVA